MGEETIIGRAGVGNLSSVSTRRARKPKPCRYFHKNDCWRGDECRMAHTLKDQLDPCQAHCLWLGDPWGRDPCVWGEDCTYPHPEGTGLTDPDMARVNVALQTEGGYLKRLAAYVESVLGVGGLASVVGVTRSGTSRFNQHALLVEAKDPQLFSKRCSEDPVVCRVVLRVYIVGDGMASSMEDVGRQVSTIVSSQKLSASSLPDRGQIDSCSSEVPRDRKRFQEVGGVLEGDTKTYSPSFPSPVSEPPPSSQAPTTTSLGVRVQGIPKVMEEDLVQDVSPSWVHFLGMTRERQVGNFAYVLSIVYVRGAYLFGLSEASAHVGLLINGNQNRSAVSRAFYKLKEVTIRANLSYISQWIAVDIGSAPGGWTSFLAARCRQVLSVDPAEMDPTVVALPNVVHIKKKIELSHEDLLFSMQAMGNKDATTGDSIAGSHGVTQEEEYIGVDEGSQACSQEEVVGADVIVSDMNTEPEVLATVLLAVLKSGVARPGAMLVATLKDFCGPGRRMLEEVQLAIERLEGGSPGLQDLKQFHLLAGGQAEITIVGWVEAKA
ncbi:unnamed protein product [Choristocarpus tenellus]